MKFIQTQNERGKKWIQTQVELGKALWIPPVLAKNKGVVLVAMKYVKERFQGNANRAKTPRGELAITLTGTSDIQKALEKLKTHEHKEYAVIFQEEVPPSCVSIKQRVKPSKKELELLEELALKNI